MSNLKDLYQELIIDHGRHPRNFKKLEGANRIKDGFNPLCGDKLTVYLRVEGDVVTDVTFEGAGCAISMASSSLMTQILKGKNLEEVRDLFKDFHSMAIGESNQGSLDRLGKLAVLQGVCEFPSRVKCATLSWHTVIAAIENKTGNVTTE